MKPESVVIVKWQRGYVGYIRFSDSRYDRNISHSYKPVLYTEIEKYVRDISIQDIS